MKRMKRPWKLSCQKHPKCNAHLLILLQKNWQKSRQKFGLICRVGRFCWWIHEEVTEVISCLQIYHRFSGNAKKKNSNIYKDTLLSTKAINSIGISFFFKCFSDDASVRLQDLDEKLVQCFQTVGEILSKYRSGKLPKIFKRLPNLDKWEQVQNLFFTHDEFCFPFWVQAGFLLSATEKSVLWHVYLKIVLSSSCWTKSVKL